MDPTNPNCYCDFCYLIFIKSTNNCNQKRMDKFIVNIIHRPEMVPEYSATVTGQGKEEDIGDKALITESLDIFKTQQRLAHENGLKVTIQMTYAALFNDEAVEITLRLSHMGKHRAGD